MSLCKDGVCVLCFDHMGRILMMKQNYGLREWVGIGGGVEPGLNESWLGAACREFHEETEMLVRSENLIHVADFKQRVVGMGGAILEGDLKLYVAKRYSRELRKFPSEEVAEVRFMSIGEIFSDKFSVKLAYKRMILQYLRCIDGIDPMPFPEPKSGKAARLSDPVEYPPLRLSA